MTRPLPQNIEHTVNWLVISIDELHAVIREASSKDLTKIVAAADRVKAARLALTVRIWQAIDAAPAIAERDEAQRVIKKGMTR